MSRCPICRQTYVKARPFQKCCTTPECALEMGKRLADKMLRETERTSIAARKQALKSRPQLVAELQKVVNEYIRLRDKDEPCISCGTTQARQWHAGHYLTTAAHPELRFDARNINRQCSQCNDHLSGNVIEQRKGILARYGQARIDWLEGPHEMTNYSRDDLIRMRQDLMPIVAKMRKEQ